MSISSLSVVSSWTSDHASVLLVVFVASGAVGSTHGIACPVLQQQEVASCIGRRANGDTCGSCDIEDESSRTSFDAGPHPGSIGSGSFVVTEVVFGAISRA